VKRHGIRFIVMKKVFIMKHYRVLNISPYDNTSQYYKAHQKKQIEERVLWEGNAESAGDAASKVGGASLRHVQIFIDKKWAWWWEE
jgi:hypothetical protein